MEFNTQTKEALMMKYEDSDLDEIRREFYKRHVGTSNAGITKYQERYLWNPINEEWEEEIVPELWRMQMWEEMERQNRPLYRKLWESLF